MCVGRLRSDRKWCLTKEERVRAEKDQLSVRTAMGDLRTRLDHLVAEETVLSKEKVFPVTEGRIVGGADAVGGEGVGRT